MIRQIGRALDSAMDSAVVVGYSRLGYSLRNGLGVWDDVPRLDGKRVLVTGASSGIGFAAAQGLAALGAELKLLVRDPERGELARERIVDATQNSAIELLECDISDLSAVRNLASGLADRGDPLDILINNAGVLPATREVSAQGLELTFATNVAGPFALTGALMPLLREGAPSRVITVSSGGMYTQRLDVERLEGRTGEFDGTRAYAQSKRAQVVLSEIAAVRYESVGVSFHAMHPGWADTPGVQGSLPRFRALTRPILRSAEQAADTVIWLAGAPEGAIETGRFWHDRRPRQTYRLPGTREEPSERLRLWSRCVELAGLECSD